MNLGPLRLLPGRAARPALAATALLAAACATVPLTDRTQTQLVSSERMALMGTQAYGEILAEETVLEFGPEVDQVRRVGVRIARAAEQGKFRWAERGTYEWEFRVVKNDQVVNAWALPGGKVAVYTGILPIAGSDAGLATVMAHEIAHAIARHGGERFSHQGIAEFGRTGMELLIQNEAPETQSLLRSAFGATTQVAALLPFSRLHESEADEIGIKLMAAAGFDPREAVAFWQRMQAAGGSEPLLWLSTHPSHERRIEDLKKLLPEALEIYEGRRPLSFSAAAREWLAAR
jgi:predicted Zn-dependent protease